MQSQGVNPNVERFNREALLWDVQPRRAEMARAIVRMAERELEKLPSPRLMDYGCGTGMCTLPLAPHATSVLGVDVSPGMLEQLQAKATALGFNHVETLQHDLATQPLESRPFDAILTAMALHHVRDVAIVLKRFRELLTPGGLAMIADLDHEDGSFHRDMTGVEHTGFRREWLLNALWDAGFRMVQIDTAHVVEKPSAFDGKPHRYPIFFMAARVRPGR